MTTLPLPCVPVRLPGMRPVAALILAVALLAGCATSPPVRPAASAPAALSLKPADKPAAAPLASREDLALLEESVNPVYRVGSGDVVRLEVFGRPEVSGKHVVGPDGRISVPIVGDLSVADRTREEIRATLQASLGQFYTRPHVTFAVDEYTSNQVTVLGRVERAGMQKFPHAPTLAEVLAGAGGMPVADKTSTLTRCAIMRGREKLIWVDLKSLLNGDMAYNIRMRKGDIVFIPDSAETAVYVMGQVARPGSYRLTPRMTILDAIAQAGGPTEDAQVRKVGLYRPGAERIEEIALDEVIGTARAANYVLEDGDVLFLPRSGLAEFGYLMRQISPGLQLLSFTASMKAASK